MMQSHSSQEPFPNDKISRSNPTRFLTPSSATTRASTNTSADPMNNDEAATPANFSISHYTGTAAAIDDEEGGVLISTIAKRPLTASRLRNRPAVSSSLPPVSSPFTIEIPHLKNIHYSICFIVLLALSTIVQTVRLSSASTKQAGHDSPNYTEGNLRASASLSSTTEVEADADQAFQLFTSKTAVTDNEQIADETMSVMRSATSSVLNVNSNAMAANGNTDLMNSNNAMKSLDSTNTMGGNSMSGNGINTMTSSTMGDSAMTGNGMNTMTSPTMGGSDMAGTGLNTMPSSTMGGSAMTGNGMNTMAQPNVSEGTTNALIGGNAIGNTDSGYAGNTLNQQPSPGSGYAMNTLNQQPAPGSGYAGNALNQQAAPGSGYAMNTLNQQQAPGSLSTLNTMVDGNSMSGNQMNTMTQQQTGYASSNMNGAPMNTPSGATAMLGTDTTMMTGGNSMVAGQLQQQPGVLEASTASGDNIMTTMTGNVISDVMQNQFGSTGHIYAGASGVSQTMIDTNNSAKVDVTQSDGFAQDISFELVELSNFKDSWDLFEPSDVPVFFSTGHGDEPIEDLMRSCHRLVLASDGGLADGHGADTVSKQSFDFPERTAEWEILSPFVMFYNPVRCWLYFTPVQRMETSTNDS